VTDLDELIQALQQEIRIGQDANGTNAGMLAGLLDTGSARVESQPGENVYQHAGYLSGHLLRWLAERGRGLDDRIRLITAGYAASLADPAGQAALDKPDRPMTAHSYAVIRCERAGRQLLSEADERMLFGWLVEQTRTPLTQQLTAKFHRLRTRRQDRLAAGGPG
jgi:hypothetical protein